MGDTGVVPSLHCDTHSETESGSSQRTQDCFTKTKSIVVTTISQGSAHEKELSLPCARDVQAWGLPASACQSGHSMILGWGNILGVSPEDSTYRLQSGLSLLSQQTWEETGYRCWVL